MDEELKKIKKLTAFMRKAGILSLKSGDIELILSADALNKQGLNALDDSQSSDAPQGGPSDEALLFWSAPGILPLEPESELS